GSEELPQVVDRCVRRCLGTDPERRAHPPCPPSRTRTVSGSVPTRNVDGQGIRLPTTDSAVLSPGWEYHEVCPGTRESMHLDRIPPSLGEACAWLGAVPAAGESVQDQTRRHAASQA